LHSVVKQTVSAGESATSKTSANLAILESDIGIGTVVAARRDVVIRVAQYRAVYQDGLNAPKMTFKVLGD
jgi:hypothetical protein